MILSKALDRILDSIQIRIEKMKIVLIDIRDGFKEVTSVIQKRFGFLFNTVKMCGKDVMRPSKKCDYILKNAYDDCTTKVARWLCSPVLVLRKGLCPVLRFADAICKIPSRIADNLVSHIGSKFDKVFKKFKEVCQVKIVHNTSMHFNVN